MKRMIKLAGIAAALCLLCGGCMAEESALPRLEPVSFPSGAAYTFPSQAKENNPPNAACYGQDGLSYHDDSLDVRIHRIRAYDTPVAVAFVQIADARQLRTELARPYPSEATVRVSQLAKRVNAVLAVNADWFVYHNSGIIYRDGKLLRNRPDAEYDGLAIDGYGDFHIVSPLTEEGFQAIIPPVIHSFAFGPALVIDGELQEIKDRKVTYKQRMAIGQIAPLSYVLVATDGPEEKDSVGLSVPQLAQLMYDLGAVNAYNLDGGQSTCMLLNVQKVNGQKALKMRNVGDIIYFTTAVPGAEAR